MELRLRTEYCTFKKREIRCEARLVNLLIKIIANFKNIFKNKAEAVILKMTQFCL